MGDFNHTAHAATAGDGGERTWHRDGALLYTLKPHVNQFGRSRGKMVNDVTVRVEGPGADTIATEIHAALAQAPAVQAPAGEESRRSDGIDRQAIAQAMDQDGGWWKSCSGCHETNEGQETGHYPYSKLFRCHVGAGCSECGGLGVRWEYYSDADLAAMADELAPAQPNTGETGGGWVPISQARHDCTLYELMVPTPTGNGLRDALTSLTIGSNNGDHDGEDRWTYVGWDWEQDRYIHMDTAEGDPVPTHFREMRPDPNGQPASEPDPATPATKAETPGPAEGAR